MSGNLTEKQKETLAEVRKKAINMLLACEQIDEGEIDWEEFESRITKRSY